MENIISILTHYSCIKLLKIYLKKYLGFFKKNLFLKNLKTTYENSMNVVWEWMKSEKHRIVVITMVPPNSSITWFYEKELGGKKRQQGRKRQRERGRILRSIFLGRLIKSHSHRGQISTHIGNSKGQVQANYLVAHSQIDALRQNTNYASQASSTLWAWAKNVHHVYTAKWCGNLM